MACGGTLFGVVLLTFAGSLVIVGRFSSADGSASLRRLQFAGQTSVLTGAVQPGVPIVTTSLQPALPAVVGGAFPTGQGVGTMPPWTPTTINPLGTTHRSSFDSSDSSSSSSYGSSFESSKSSESSLGSLHSSGLAGEQASGIWFIGGGFTTFQVLFMLCFAFVYNKSAVQPVLEARGTLKAMNLSDTFSDDFDNGICECCSDKWVCIHGFFCPMIRMAHTNAVAGICGFWETALIWCCCALISVNLGPCCLMVYWRMQLKQIMGIADHVLNDVCLTIFCPWLSICQQGTAVDTKLGYQVVGCCDLEWDKGVDLYAEAERGLEAVD